MICFVYILRSLVKEKYYVGISSKPDRRLHFHNTIEKGFTSRYRPWERVYLRECKDKSEALKLEKKIKSWKSKIMIQKVVNGEISI